MPFSSTLISGNPTSFGFFGSGLSASNFTFTNLLDATDCIGSVTFSNLPAYRYHVKFQLFRSSATSFGTDLAYAFTGLSGVYFNRDYPNNDNYLLDEVTYTTALDPIGPEYSLNSNTSNFRSLHIDFYMTCTSSTNSATLTFTKSGDFPSLNVSSQNGLFTIVCVGPSTQASDDVLNFVDDLNFQPG